MKKNIIIFLAMISSFWIFFALSAEEIFIEKKNYSEALKLLVGKWQASTGKQKLIETWQKNDALLFSGTGISYDIQSDKELSKESLIISELNNELFYIAKVNHNDLPISFKLTSANDSTLVFENAKHDFPKKITYFFKSHKSLHVSVSNESDTLNFNFKRL